MNCLPDTCVSRTKLIMMFKYFTALFACLVGLSATAQTEAIYMPTAPLTIVTQAGEITIMAEVADDPEETATGLMFREGIAADAGMIFDFGVPREANMWMKNVPFSIDMLFLGEDGEVLTIVSHVQANSERRINPGFAVNGVVELAAGQAKAFGIAPGDTVLHPIFGNWVDAEESSEEAIEETPAED